MFKCIIFILLYFDQCLIFLKNNDVMLNSWSWSVMKTGCPKLSRQTVISLLNTGLDNCQRYWLDKEIKFADIGNVLCPLFGLVPHFVTTNSIY